MMLYLLIFDSKIILLKYMNYVKSVKMIYVILNDHFF